MAGIWIPACWRHTGLRPICIPIAKFEISTFIDDRGSCLKGVFNYATCLYEAETDRKSDHDLPGDIKAISEFAKNPHRQESLKIGDSRYLTAERLPEDNPYLEPNERDYPKEKTLHALFKEQARRTPERTAVIFEEKRVRAIVN